MSITPRQMQVVELIARGFTRKQIALQMNISPRTVDDHCEAAYKAYGVRNRFGLISKFPEMGLPCPCCGRGAQ